MYFVSRLDEKARHPKEAARQTITHLAVLSVEVTLPLDDWPGWFELSFGWRVSWACAWMLVWIWVWSERVVFQRERVYLSISWTVCCWYRLEG